MKLHTIVYLVGMLLAVLLASMAAPAQAADRKAELRAKFEQRYPQIQQYKTAGKIGETTAGVLEVVDPKAVDAAVTTLMAEENADRTELYQLIAKDEGTTPALVAERNAVRNFTKAKPGEYLKEKNGTWRKKA